MEGEMTMELEQVELTEAQARELEKMSRRAYNMYDDRKGGEGVCRNLSTLMDGLEKVQEGERDALYLGLGMAGSGREDLISIIEREKEMEERKNRQGYPVDGRKVKALERGLESMKNPEMIEESELED